MEKPSNRNELDFGFGEEKIQVGNEFIHFPLGTKFKQVKAIQQVVVNNKKQFILKFSLDLEGYSEDRKYKCGGVELLGGYCVDQINDLLFNVVDLPQHNYVKIKGKISLLDYW